VRGEVTHPPSAEGNNAVTSQGPTTMSTRSLAESIAQTGRGRRPCRPAA